MDQLNIVGREMFFKLITAAYWFFAILIFFDIARNAARHNNEGVIKALINGCISFGAIYMITTLLDIIKGCF